MRTFKKHVVFLADDCEVRFIPIARLEAPGLSHRVLVTVHKKHMVGALKGTLNGRNEVVAKDWLSSDANPSAKAAAFYADKHTTAINLANR